MTLENIAFDSETCGFHGLACLLQYGKLEDAWDENIHLHDPWHCPIDQTFELIEWMMSGRLIAFNLAFDHFHLQKLYTTFYVLKQKLGNVIPIDVLDSNPKLIWDAEEAARDVDLCLKPAAALDLLIHAKMHDYQGLLERKNINIRRVPTQLAVALMHELNARVQLPDIYFKRKKDTSIRFQIDDVDERPDLKNVVLRFKPSAKLKDLIQHAYPDQAGVIKYDEIDPITLYGDEMKPFEVAYAPYTNAAEKLLFEHHRVGKNKKKKTARLLMDRYIGHWKYNEHARVYASDDIKYLRMLWEHLGRPLDHCTNSELSCMVASVRWRGFRVDIDQITAQREEAVAKMRKAPRAAVKVKQWLFEACNPIEQMGIPDTKKQTLAGVEQWECINEDCENGKVADQSCPDCKGTGKHPVARRAKAVRLARTAEKRKDMCDKILLAGRAHAAFKVLGTKSNRMSGDGKFSLHGIPHAAEVRKAWPLAWPGLTLYGGDFDAFEVGLTEAEYGDPELRKALMSGKKIHTLMAMEMYPDSPGIIETIESGECLEIGGKFFRLISVDEATEEQRYQFINTQCNDDAKEMYTKGKNGVFTIIYFGDENTLIRKYGVKPANAKAAYDGFLKRFCVLAEKRQRIIDDYSCVTQPNGVGTAVKWSDPKNSVADHTGFKRYFDLEYEVCRRLFDLAQSPPPAWRKYEGTVKRGAGEDAREQRLGGAVQSALYGAVFGIQGQCVRAAGNHKIQCWGASITKDVQLSIWRSQPVGITPWRVMPMNVHDEIMCPLKDEVADEVAGNVSQTIEKHRASVPMINMDWSRLESWGDK